MADQSAEKFRVCVEMRKLENELFWKRAMFFWAFIAAAFIGFVDSYKEKPSFGIVVACFGVVCSVAWSLVNRGSKRWEMHWHSLLVQFESENIGDLFAIPVQQLEDPERHRMSWMLRRYSVSNLTIALSDFVCVIWLFILLFSLVSVLSPSKLLPQIERLIVVILPILSAIYVVVMEKTCRIPESQSAPRSTQPMSRSDAS